MENKNQEDLDLLLSLDDGDERVLETPPGSPSAPPGEIRFDSIRLQNSYSFTEKSRSSVAVYLTDEEESPKRRRGQADLSDFRSVVQDCIDYDPKPLPKTTNKPKCDIEKFSGLRLRLQKLKILFFFRICLFASLSKRIFCRNQLLSPAEISDLFSDIRFVRLQTIK